MNELISVLNEFVTNTVKKIVDHPNDVEVNIITTTKSFDIQVKVAKTDIGQVLGKSGKTINALSVILKAIKNTNYSKDGRTCLIEVLEDENSTYYLNQGGNRNEIKQRIENKNS